jgi:hypothetical protein
MKLNLKLGESHSESAIPTNPGEKPSEMYYPELTFREKDEPEFPEEGVMKIRYKKTRTSMDKKSKKPYQCTIEVHEIISAEGKKEEAGEDAPTKKFDEAGDALDKIAKTKGY